MGNYLSRVREFYNISRKRKRVHRPEEEEIIEPQVKRCVGLNFYRNLTS